MLEYGPRRYINSEKYDYKMYASIWSPVIKNSEFPRLPLAPFDGFQLSRSFGTSKRSLTNYSKNLFSFAVRNIDLRFRQQALKEWAIVFRRPILYAVVMIMSIMSSIMMIFCQSCHHTLMMIFNHTYSAFTFVQHAFKFSWLISRSVLLHLNMTMSSIYVKYN